MKKAFTLVLALALVLLLSLTACGNGSESPDPTPTSSESNRPDPAPTNSGGATANTQGSGADNTAQPTENGTNADNSVGMTKEEFLAFFGLDIDAVEPEGFTNIEIYGCTTKEGDVFLQVEEASVTPENVQAWFEKIFLAIKQISDDGKLYDSLVFDTEYEAPTTYGSMVYTTFTYKYDGKGILVTLSYDPLGFGMSKNEIKKISTYQIMLAME